MPGQQLTSLKNNTFVEALRRTNDAKDGPLVDEREHLISITERLRNHNPLEQHKVFLGKELKEQRELEQARAGIALEGKEKAVGAAIQIELAKPIVAPGQEGTSSKTWLAKIEEAVRKFFKRDPYEMTENKKNQMRNRSGAAVDHRRTKQIWDSGGQEKALGNAASAQ